MRINKIERKIGALVDELAEYVTDEEYAAETELEPLDAADAITGTDRRLTGHAARMGELADRISLLHSKLTAQHVQRQAAVK